MTKVYNRFQNKERRRMLRNNMPEAEKILWSKLQKKQQMGYRFHRQFSVSNYVIDFYCPKLKLAIEVDGKSHLTKNVKDYDIIRQEEIEPARIKFLRFTNDDVIKNLKIVIKKIRLEINELTPLAPLY